MKRIIALPNAGYAARRRAAYEAEIPAHELIEALAENAGGRPAKLAAVEARRQAIKKRFPKPST